MFIADEVTTFVFSVSCACPRLRLAFVFVAFWFALLFECCLVLPDPVGFKDNPWQVVVVVD